MTALLDLDAAIAMAQALGAAAVPRVASVSVARIAGRVAAAQVAAPINLPPFRNSAMDGYALRAADLDGASMDTPVRLPCNTIIAAGDCVEAPLPTGHCAEIMTGAPVPDGADAVVPIELTQRESPGWVSFANPEGEARHIRAAGEDIGQGDIVLQAGQALRAGHILPLASLGIGAVDCYAKPRIALLATGRELAAAADADTPLKPGQIHNSSLPYAHAMLDAAGAEIILARQIGDDLAALQKAIEAAQAGGADAIITTGGVSAGRYDLVPDALTALGAETLFHKLRVRPGKPQLLARLSDGVPVFALPGNPVSTAVGLRFLVLPWLRALLRQPAEAPIMASLAADVDIKPGLRWLLKAQHHVDVEGRLHVTAMLGQFSFMTAPMAGMTCWLDLPDGGVVRAGDSVRIHPLQPGMLDCPNG